MLFLNFTDFKSKGNNSKINSQSYGIYFFKLFFYETTEPFEIKFG